MGLTWEQEIALTAAQQATQAKEAEFTRQQRTLLFKQLEKRFQRPGPEAVRLQVEAATLAQLNAARERVLTIQSLEELTF
jgi:hypothetical protein